MEIDLPKCDTNLQSGSESQRNDAEMQFESEHIHSSLLQLIWRKFI